MIADLIARVAAEKRGGVTRRLLERPGCREHDFVKREEIARGFDGEPRGAAPEGSAHHVVVRIDGGKWIAPANLPRLDDELGGTVGLVQALKDQWE